ncbi:hypothetical protein BTZ20_3840 [Rhodococcus sp. MTM3W5.2]|nr:hypothetical protein BTZ20_3840 [Rhodococcus sp. MTM3W5.2]
MLPEPDEPDRPMRSPHRHKPRAHGRKCARSGPPRMSPFSRPER